MSGARLAHRSCEGRAGPLRHWSRDRRDLATSRLVAPDASPRHRDGRSRGRQFARQLRGTPTRYRAADVAGTHRGRRPAHAPGLDLLTAGQTRTRNHQPGE